MPAEDTNLILTAIKDGNIQMIKALERSAETSEKALDRLTHAIENIPPIKERIPVTATCPMQVAGLIKSSNGGDAQKTQWQTIAIVLAVMTALMSPILVLVSSSSQQNADLKNELADHAALTGHVGLVGQAAKSEEQNKAVMMRVEDHSSEINRLRDRWESSTNRNDQGAFNR